MEPTSPPDQYFAVVTLINGVFTITYYYDSMCNVELSQYTLSYPFPAPPDQLNTFSACSPDLTSEGGVTWKTMSATFASGAELIQVCRLSYALCTHDSAFPH